MTRRLRSAALLSQRERRTIGRQRLPACLPAAYEGQRCTGVRMWRRASYRRGACVPFPPPPPPPPQGAVPRTPGALRLLRSVTEPQAAGGRGRGMRHVRGRMRSDAMPAGPQR